MHLSCVRITNINLYSGYGGIAMADYKVDLTEHKVNGEVVLISTEERNGNKTSYEILGKNEKPIYTKEVDEPELTDILDRRFQMEIDCYSWGFVITEGVSTSKGAITQHQNNQLARNYRCNVRIMNYEGENLCEPAVGVSPLSAVLITRSEKSLQKYMKKNPLKVSESSSENSMDL